MDLASFISGIGPTTSFTPGSNTPPPFNVQHTGLTDGTGPATASKNMAEIYNRILLEIRAVVVAAGMTPDNTNWTQMQAAIKKIATDSVSGSVGQVTTRPKYDSSTAVATTEFVANALGNVAGISDILNSMTIQGNSGGWVALMSTKDVTLTISSDSFPAGAVLYIIGAMPLHSQATLSISGNGQFLAGLQPPAWPDSTFKTMPIRGYNQLTIVKAGINWVPIDSGASRMYYGYWAGFGSVTLGAGIAIMWGADNTAVNGASSRTVMFPISFPNQCDNVVITGRNSSGSAGQRTFPQLVNWNTTSFTYINQGATSAISNQGASFIAMGR